MLKIVVFAASIATALKLASTAFASSLNCAHGSNCGAGTLGGGAGTNSGGTLPFTGLDLAGIIGIASLLIGAGITLYRVGRPN
jgi:hypothetical protein